MNEKLTSAIEFLQEYLGVRVYISTESNLCPTDGSKYIAFRGKTEGQVVHIRNGEIVQPESHNPKGKGH